MERFDNEFMVIRLVTHLHKPFVFLAGGDVAAKNIFISIRIKVLLLKSRVKIIFKSDKCIFNE